jgi:hypothetical protein
VSVTIKILSMFFFVHMIKHTFCVMQILRFCFILHPLNKDHGPCFDNKNYIGCCSFTFIIWS